MSTFDQLTKGLASGGLSRRDGLKLAFGGAAAAALSTLGFGSAAAAPSTNLCLGQGGNCTNGFFNCPAHKNTNCYCFTNAKGVGFCGCNQYCSQSAPCTKNRQCGLTAMCAIDNGCTGCGASSGVCIAKCSKRSTCVLAAGSGATAA